MCEGTKAELQCSGDFKVRIDLLFFGRYGNDTCAHETVTGDEDCPTPAGSFRRMVELCNGREQCWYEALISVWGDPCPGVTKQAHVEYTCQSKIF